MSQSSHSHSPEWPPDSTGRRTHRSRRIWVSLALRTAAWSRESSGADCLAVWGEQSQSLWFLSRSSHSRRWRAGSTKQFKTRTAIISFCSAKLVHSRARQIGHQDLSDQALLTHVRVKQYYSCCAEDCTVRMTIRRITLRSEKHSNSVWKAYDPLVCIHHKDCAQREKNFLLSVRPIPPV